MDYEKAYKEALKRAKSFRTPDNKDVAAYIFPELAESEDEEIRQELISLFRDCINGKNHPYNSCDSERWLAWLEKQGVKPTNNVEPKFKFGDWIIDIQGVAFNRIINSDGESYQIETCCSNFWLPIHITEKNYRLWTIQDAQDGDVLVTPLPKGYEAGEQIFIFKEIKCRDYVDNCIEYYCRVCKGVFYENEFGFMGTTTDGIFHPATKEQRDLLFQKMKEAGYEWDAEKKELKKVEQKQILDVEIPFGAKDSELEEVSYNIPNGYHAEIEDNKVVIKKGEKKYVEWSEEDESWFDEVWSCISKEYPLANSFIFQWFKSLKDRYTWKPSKEQLDGLKEAIEFLGCTKTRREQLQSLYEQLKKLREE